MSKIKVNRLENTATTDGGVDIDATGHVQIDGVQMPTAGAFSSRRININGAMQVAQRGTTVTGIGVDDFTCCDRWRHFASAGGQAGRCTATQENVTDLAGFDKALKLQVTTTETPASDESYGLNTRFEVQDIKGLGIGSANSVPLTLSFYAKAPTGNGVFCAGIVMSGGGSYIEEVTIGTSWSRHEINIPATSISSHATTQSNDVLLGLEVQITLMAGSSVDGHANGVWENGGSNRATSNQSNFYSSTSNNLFVTGVQLERGTKATPFEHRSFGDELAKCQRYFYRLQGDNNDRVGIGGYATATSEARFDAVFPQAMRAVPTLAGSGNAQFDANDDSADFALSSIIVDGAPTGPSGAITSIGLQIATSGLTAGQAGGLRFRSASATFNFSSEL